MHSSARAVIFGFPQSKTGCFVGKSVNKKIEYSSSASIRQRMAAAMRMLNGISTRGRLIAWLLTFIAAYRLGLPILFSAALSALPWLLLPQETDRV